MQEVRQNLEKEVLEVKEKVKEGLDKKLETAEHNRETLIQTKLDHLKKHVRISTQYACQIHIELMV